MVLCRVGGCRAAHRVSSPPGAPPWRRGCQLATSVCRLSSVSNSSLKSSSMFSSAAWIGTLRTNGRARWKHLSRGSRWSRPSWRRRRGLPRRPPARRRPPCPPSPAGATPASVSSFDAPIAGPLKKVTDLAAPLGPEVADATALFAKAFEAEAVVVSAIAACKKPDVGALQKLLLPVGEPMMKVGEKAEGRRTDQFNHCKTLAEAVQALSFVAFQGPDMGMSMPVAHVSEAWQSAEFYSNKILMQYRASAPEHVEWVKAVKDLVDTSLKQYVKEHHTTGPAWNPKGGDVASWKPSAAGSAPKPAGGLPLPSAPATRRAHRSPRRRPHPPPRPLPPGLSTRTAPLPLPAPRGHGTPCSRNSTRARPSPAACVRSPTT